jgi:hypothetical protein
MTSWGAFAREMQRHVAAFLDSLLRAAPAGGPVGGKAARIVAWALLTDVPFIRCEQLGADQHEEFLDALSVLLIGGLFGYR